MSSSSPSGVRIRAAVASADRARRLRDAWTWAKTAVPIATFVGAMGGLMARAAGASPIWVITALCGPVAAVVATVVVVHRPRPLSDAIAARSDDDAGLQGELRSAHWFASQDSVDEWTAWHLDHAATTVDGVVWPSVYPRPGVTAVLAVSIVLIVAAAAVPLRRVVIAGTPAAPAAGVLSLDELDLAAVPPQLQQMVLDAAAAVLARRVSAGDALKGLEQSRDWRALAPDTRRRVDEALRRMALDTTAATGKPAPEPPGASAEQAQWAREDLAARLASERAQKKAEDPEAARAAREKSKDQAGAAEESSDGQGGEGSQFKSGQVQREVPDGKGDPSGAAMDPNGPASGEAGTGFGGKHGDPTYRQTHEAAVEAAFKREVIEAATNVGSNDHTNDRRRQTEQSASALDYARITGRSTYERAVVDTTAAVPEARLPWLERYFSRSEPR